MRPRVIQVERSSRGFGLSLIYRGLDKFEEKDTGIFVARVVPGGQAARFGVKENDKIISINNKNPRNVDDAVGIIKDAGKSIKLMLLRQEEVPDVVVDDNLSLASTEMDSNWVSYAQFFLVFSNNKKSILGGKEDINNFLLYIQLPPPPINIISGYALEYNCFSNFSNESFKSGKIIIYFLNKYL